MFYTQTFDNGIRLIHIPMPSNICCCGMVVNTGSRDQDERECGMAHFVEHNIFNGTARHTARQIANRLELLGGDLNAFTTKEVTCSYCIIPNYAYADGIKTISEMVFESTFPLKKIRKEAGVIAEEIESYKDTPSDLIFDEFESLIFGKKALGTDILGNAKTLMEYTSDDIMRFVKRTYNTDQMVLFTLGGTDWSNILKIAEKTIEHVPENRRSWTRTNNEEYTPQNKEKKKKTHQAHLIIGNRAAQIGSAEYTTTYLLNNILGGPSLNSRLSLAMKDRNGLTYEVDSNFYSYTDSGVFAIYVGTDDKNIDKCRKIIRREMDKLIDNKISSTSLDKMKKQAIGQLIIGNENKENLSIAAGKEFLLQNTYTELNEMKQLITNVTSEDIRSTAEKLFAEDELSSLLYY